MPHFGARCCLKEKEFHLKMGVFVHVVSDGIHMQHVRLSIQTAIKSFLPSGGQRGGVTVNELVFVVLCK